MVDRRKFLTLTAASLAAPAFSSQRAFAEGFPKQDVKIVVGFEPAAPPTSSRARWPTG